MKTWDRAPAKAEVEAELKAFFSLLREGKLDEARDRIAHHSDDWESQIWSLWQDTHLIYLEELDQEVEDDSFEGQAWQKDLRWLRDLGTDGVFHWDEEGDTVHPDGEHLFVNLTYQGEFADVSGDFRVVAESGKYKLVREIIHAA